MEAETRRERSLIPLGARFGRLRIVAHAQMDGPARCKCLCDCGTSIIVRSNNLKAGKNTSCGCYRRECSSARHLRHGQSQSRTYCSYRSAKARCNNPRNIDYKLYGGRGIQFKFDSFEDFYAEVGERPEGMTIDRRDNNGHYEKGNVKWSTPLQQTHNRRNQYGRQQEESASAEKPSETGA